ncbi:response regulator transcription factor [Paenibacillus gansuensis]|uniref:Response regulator n=1 Tax=Paenibacillus gansuensis TaxID=306542 RepID=A0ABW5PHU4_9BACL
MRILIVEDEHFVRKGLIHTVDWSAYGFEVVGEADNGEKALQFLAQTQGGADIVFTDIAMPIMSGIELIRELKRSYPAIRFVILTCHQDFHYVREALQLGAIDYLIKTQLEDRMFEDALQRIRLRLEEVKGEFVPLMHEERKWSIVLLENNELFRGTSTYPSLEAILEETRDNGATIIATDEPVGIIQAKDRNFLSQYFYSRHYSKRVWLWSSSPEGDMDVHWQRIESEWKSLKWIFSDLECNEWFRLVERQRPEKDKLIQLIENTLAAFALVRSEHDVNPGIAEGDPLLFWHDMKKRVSGHFLRSTLQSYTKDICLSIYKALVLMYERCSDPLNQESVAHHVGLSRGYFGQIFRPITGSSFHEMLTMFRLMTAERLLKESDELVYNISEQSGFKDEKYFSHLFKRNRGLSPSEYRLRHRRSEQTIPTRTKL